MYIIHLSLTMTVFYMKDPPINHTLIANTSYIIVGYILKWFHVGTPFPFSVPLFNLNIFVYNGNLRVVTIIEQKHVKTCCQEISVLTAPKLHGNYQFKFNPQLQSIMLQLFKRRQTKSCAQNCN